MTGISASCLSAISTLHTECAIYSTATQGSARGARGTEVDIGAEISASIYRFFAIMGCHAKALDGPISHATVEGEFLALPKALPSRMVRMKEIDHGQDYD